MDEAPRELRFQIVKVSGTLRLFAKPPTTTEELNNLLHTAFGFKLPEVPGLMSNLILNEKDNGTKWEATAYHYTWEGPFDPSSGKRFPDYFFFQVEAGYLQPVPGQAVPTIYMLGEKT